MEIGLSKKGVVKTFLTPGWFEGRQKRGSGFRGRVIPWCTDFVLTATVQKFLSISNFVFLVNSCL